MPTITLINRKNPDRPTINAGLDDREWALFNDTWTRYKTMINVVEVGAIRMELRAACSDDVNKLLFEYVGTDILDACTEEQLLDHIKSVAVKSVHKEVHQVAFNKMSQNSGESVTNYVARLKAKAFLCGFEVQCTDHQPSKAISYAEQMVSQRLVVGLANQEHQRKILAEAPVLVTLADKVRRLQMLETTEESVTMLHTSSFIPPSEAALQHASNYRNNKNKKTNGGTADATKCRWCGRSSHPGGKPIVDRPSCPAQHEKCHNCQKKGHFAGVCEKSRTEPALTVEEAGSEGQPQLDAIQSTAGVSFSFGATSDFRRSPSHAEHT